MKMHSRDIVEQVRKSRSQGLSLRQIEKQFKVSTSRISVWVKDINVENKLYQRSKKIQKMQKNKYVELGKKKNILQNEARLLASLLYWCEGSKYPSSNCIAFANSDPALVRSFVALLRKSFLLDDSKFRVGLQLHTTHNLEKMILYWSYLLQIPKTQFYKATITEPTLKRKRMNYMGTCTVKYYDVSILHNLMGIYESFGRIHIRRGG